VAPGQPGGELRAGLPEHPRADPVDQAGVLGDRDELVGAHRAERGVVPAQQRLGADRPHRGQRHHRLEDQPQLLAVDRVAQLALQRAAAAQQLVVADLVALDAVLPALLRIPQGEVGVADQLPGVRHADRGGQEDRGTLDLVRLAQHREQPVRREHRLVGRAVHEQRELVAAEPGRDVAVEQVAPQPLADLGQHRVADVVAAHVVDRLEAVEVDADQHERIVGALAVAQRLLQAAPVGQLRQRVGVGELAEVRLALPQPQRVPPHVAEREVLPADQREALDAGPRKA
jgi:hypothetical protein